MVAAERRACVLCSSPRFKVIAFMLLQAASSSPSSPWTSATLALAVAHAYSLKTAEDAGSVVSIFVLISFSAGKSFPSLTKTVILVLTFWTRFLASLYSCSLPDATLIVGGAMVSLASMLSVRKEGCLPEVGLWKEFGVDSSPLKD